MKSSDNLSPRKRMLWSVLRYGVPSRLRWYYEGHPKLRGQLWVAERRLLYGTVRKYRPEICFEIGTWRGGGSTLFLAQALHDNGEGMLHTIEVNREISQEAIDNYSAYLPELVPFVKFHLGDYRVIYGNILRTCGPVGFLFLDGAEDADETLHQFELFAPHLGAGSIVMAHDWFTEKARLVRSLLEDRPEWEVKSILSPPASVGLALFRHR